MFALLVSGSAWLQRAIAPAPRPHAVLRIALLGLDIGADACLPAPAQPAMSKYGPRRTTLTTTSHYCNFLVRWRSRWCRRAQRPG